MQNFPPFFKQVFNKDKDKNIAGLPYSILQPQSILVHGIRFPSNKVISVVPVIQVILAATAFICCWQLYRQPFSRTPFLTELISKTDFLGVQNSKQRKTKKFHNAFDQFDQFLTSLKLKI